MLDYDGYLEDVVQDQGDFEGDLSLILMVGLFNWMSISYQIVHIAV